MLVELLLEELLRLLELVDDLLAGGLPCPLFESVAVDELVVVLIDGIEEVLDDIEALIFCLFDDVLSQLFRCPIMWSFLIVLYVQELQWKGWSFI